MLCVCFCDGRIARRKVKNVQKGIYYWSIQAASLVHSPFLSRATHFRRRTLEEDGGDCCCDFRIWKAGAGAPSSMPELIPRQVISIRRQGGNILFKSWVYRIPVCMKADMLFLSSCCTIRYLIQPAPLWRSPLPQSGLILAPPSFH